MHVAIEIGGQPPWIASVRIHYVKVRDGVALALEVEAGVRDLLAVGRCHGIRVRTLAAGERPDTAILDANSVNVRALEIVIRVGRSLGRRENPLPVRRPGRSAVFIFA